MLTELATIKTRLGIADADVKDDAILTNAIAAVSARFERDANRTFGRTVDATDEFEGDETELRLSVYPVETVLQLDLKTNEADGWIEQEDAEFVLRKNCVVSLTGRIGTTTQVLRVTYTGGFCLPADQDDKGNAPDGQTALPADLEQACVEQVCHWYQNRNRLGLVAVSGEGGSISQYAQLDLLPSVKAVIKRYERWMP